MQNDSRLRVPAVAIDAEYRFSHRRRLCPDPKQFRTLHDYAGRFKRNVIVAIHKSTLVEIIVKCKKKNAEL